MSVVFFLDLRKQHQDDHITLFKRFLKKVLINDIIEKDSLCAIKIHVGEDGNLNFVSPLYVACVVNHIRRAKAVPFLTDTTTLYNGRRYRGDLHIALAQEHGFTFAPFIVADGLYGDDYREVNNAKIARLFTKIHTMVCVSHFKGHLACGFGGAIKNMGMGCASKGGKLKMHSQSKPRINGERCTRCLRCFEYCMYRAIKKGKKKIVIDETKCVGCGGCMSVCPERAIVFSWSAASTDLQKDIAHYASESTRDKKVYYISFLINISPNCDCFHTNEPMIADDIGILASMDPVSIDQACYDMVKEEIDALHPEVNAQEQLMYAEEFGAGERAYEIQSV